MKKVSVRLVLVTIMMALALVNNVTACAEVLLWEDLETLGGMNYFSNEVVNATENEYVVEIFSDEIMTTVSPSIVRWRWVRDDSDADWMYSYKGCPVVGARLEDGHNPSWDLLEVQYEGEDGNFSLFSKQAVAFDEESAARFYGNVRFRRLYFATAKEYNVMVECKYQFIISIFDEDGNAKLSRRTVEDGSLLIGNMHPGDIITVTPYEGQNEGLTQSYTF